MTIDAEPNLSMKAAALLVSRLFVASARDFGQSHVEVYREALGHLPDDVIDQAGRDLVKWVSWDNPPSVRMVLDQVQVILRNREPEAPALVEETDPVVADPERARAGLEEAMAQLRRNQRMPAGERRAYQPDMPGPPRLPTDAHSMGDHQFCGPDCVPVAATHAAGDHRFCAPDCQDTPPSETEPATQPEGANT